MTPVVLERITLFLKEGNLQWAGIRSISSFPIELKKLKRERGKETERNIEIGDLREER